MFCPWLELLSLEEEDELELTDALGPGICGGIMTYMGCGALHLDDLRFAAFVFLCPPMAYTGNPPGRFGRVGLEPRSRR